MDERGMIEAEAGDRAALICASYRRLTGEKLVGEGQDLWSAPIAVVAHDTRPDPRFFYANRLALELFRMRAVQFNGMESRFSTGETDRAERAAMLGELEARDVVRGYRGVRVAGDGTRFVIENAVIWNLRDDAGERCGQAAAFANWQLLG